MTDWYQLQTTLASLSPPKAIRELTQFLVAQPGYIPALRELAQQQATLALWEEAAATMREVYLTTPLSVDETVDFAKWLQYAGQEHAALEQLVPLSTRHPDHVGVWQALAQLWRSLGEGELAARASQRLRLLCPDLPVASHSAAPPELRTSFVRALFDGYAPNFEEHITALGYQVPQLLAAALARHQINQTTTHETLDLGCGTGLLGPILAPLSAQLIGVDLSSKMLGVADTKGDYDALAEQEAVEFLQLTPHRFDLVVIADMLCYLGDLAALWQGLDRVLRPGGWLLATHELLVQPSNNTADPTPYVLQPSRRYAHQMAYVSQLCQQHLWHVREHGAVQLRQEKQQPVSGGLLVVQKI